MDSVKKNKTADTGKYTYQYVDIAQIHGYLAENNMSYYQFIDRIGDDDYIMTVRIINGEEKPPLRGCRVADATLVGVSNPAQEQGSALTYARRYSLLMAFGLATEDDDAQSLSRPKEGKKASDKQIALIRSMIEPGKEKRIVNFYAVNVLEDLTINQASEVIGMLKEKKEKKPNV